MRAISSYQKLKNKVVSLEAEIDTLVTDIHALVTDPEGAAGQTAKIKYKSQYQVEDLAVSGDGTDDGLRGILNIAMGYADLNNINPEPLEHPAPNIYVYSNKAKEMNKKKEWLEAFGIVFLLIYLGYLTFEIYYYLCQIG